MADLKRRIDRLEKEAQRANMERGGVLVIRAEFGESEEDAIARQYPDGLPAHETLITWATFPEGTVPPSFHLAERKDVISFRTVYEE